MSELDRHLPNWPPDYFAILHAGDSGPLLRPSESNETREAFAHRVAGLVIPSVFHTGIKLSSVINGTSGFVDHELTDLTLQEIEEQKYWWRHYRTRPPTTFDINGRVRPEVERASYMSTEPMFGDN